MDFKVEFVPRFKKYIEIDKINFKNLSKKNQKTECDIMDLNKKILIISMLVMLVCCVSAVSATDIDSSDDVSDDIVVDEVTDVVEDVEIDEVEDDPVEENEEVIDECECNCEGANSVTINDTNYVNYFDNDGWTTTNNNLTFVGNFTPKTFGNFKIGSSIIVNACGATFTNVGFDLKVSYITLCGGTFIGDATTNLTSVISTTADHATIKCVAMNLTAPENKTFYAIDIENSDAELLNNNIYYVDNYSNIGYYNYVVRVNGGSNLKMAKNTITAILPMKTVVYENLTGINRDFVAGIAISSSHDINFTNNTLDLSANDRLGYYPTLDAFLIYNSHRANIEKNIITVKDTVSKTGENSYIYGIDAFECDTLKINNNTITMNADKSGGYIGGNGTGAAYCVQLTGGYTGAIISNNTLTTQNNGPNAAIYSQNWNGQTDVTITGNTITVTGKGTSTTWDLLTGIELQDDNAVVTGNTITVNNNGDYDTGYNVYGISYCQYSPRYHTYTITNNTVTVNEGFYTVYIMDGLNCNVTGNTLNSNYHDEYEDIISQSGNTTVSVAGTGNTIGPNP